MSRFLKIGVMECFNMVSIHGTTEIDLDNYPELNGMTDDEALKYIQINLHKMKPSAENADWAGHLFDELMEEEVITERESDYSVVLYKE